MRRLPLPCALWLFALASWPVSGGAVAAAQAVEDGAAEDGADKAVDEGVEADGAEVDGAAAGTLEPLDDERARSHFAAAESHYGAARWSDAAREFALAYELSRRPEMLVNLSRAHERDGALLAAVADLELLLSQHPSSSYRGEAEERIAAMRAQLAAQQQAREASAASAAGAQSAAVSAERGRLPKWPRLALAAGGLASAIVALGTGVRAHRMYRALERDCPDDLCAGPFESDRDRGRALARTASGLTVVGVVLGGAAVALWVHDLRLRKRQLALGVSSDGQRSGLHLRSEF
jgi:hypothetical protein